MRFEWFIAKRLKVNARDGGHTSAHSLNVALCGIVLAIVIMILSIAIVRGFKNVVSGKIFALDPHLRIENANLEYTENFCTVHITDVEPVLRNSSVAQNIESVSLVAEKSAVLKTDTDFKGIMYRGVDANYDWKYLSQCLVEGRVPQMKGDSVNVNEIVVSQRIARELQIGVGEKIRTYFIDNAVKMRNCEVVGVFNTDFDAFDNYFIIGNIAQLQQINKWESTRGSYVSVNLRDHSNLKDDAYAIYSALAQSVSQQNGGELYSVASTRDLNAQYFSWLDLLDMNVVIILILMALVAAFTLISALLIIVLERIRFIGTLKTLGARNASIRSIFIYLTQKLILKAMLLGNAIGIGMSLLQHYFHIVRLDPENYYMSYVPISLNIWHLIILNVSILVVSYLTLIIPSLIISTLNPATSTRYE